MGIWGLELTRVGAGESWGQEHREGILCRKEERLRADSFIRFLGCGIEGKAKAALGQGRGKRGVRGQRDEAAALTDGQRRDQRHLVVAQ